MKRVAARRNGTYGGRPRNAERFTRRIQDVCSTLATQLPGIDPGDLRLIVRCLLLPPERRAVFVHKRKDGRYVF
jgi:hypothetical protein